MPKKKVTVYPDHVIDVDVYDMQVAVFFTVEGADYYFHHEWGEPENEWQEQFGEGTRAMAFRYVPDDGTGHIHGVIIPKKIPPETLAHECSHLADMISDTIGMPMTMDTTEPRGYLVQYLFKEIDAACKEWAKEYPAWRRS